MKKNKIVINGIKNFNLDQTLDCGQAFRWNKESDGSYSGVAFGRAINVARKDEDLIIYGSTEKEFESIWRDYFDLGTDYEKIRREISAFHPNLARASDFAPGIRILRQEPFETLCSFIISQNNNIKRIKGIIQRLCENFGENLGDGFFAFPTAENLAALSEEDLAPLRAGFRARYLLDCAKKVHRKEVDFEICRTAKTELAEAELMKICGVGKKVADCVLLFGFYRLECFPVDVWIKRAMEQLFPGIESTSLGSYAGIAQQYIFHYARLNPDIFN